MNIAWDKNNILALRKCLKLTQDKFAAHLGVHRRTIEMWETGFSKPGPKNQQRLNKCAISVEAQYAQAA